jgi:hypothetical protein
MSTPRSTGHTLRAYRIPLRHLPFTHAHDPISHPIRLSLVAIIRLIDLEFGLQTQALLPAALLALATRHRAITAGAFALEQPAWHRKGRRIRRYDLLPLRAHIIFRFRSEESG